MLPLGTVEVADGGPPRFVDIVGFPGGLEMGTRILYVTSNPYDPDGCAEIPFDNVGLWGFPGGFRDLPDSFVRAGSPNKNEGANPQLVVRQQGNIRSLIRFDLPQFGLPAGWTAARLVLTIDSSDPPGGWGPSGRPVNVHRITGDWAEGNGMSFEQPPPDPGSGEGVTWNCAVDTDISDMGSDCPGSLWNGGESAIATATAPSANITNGMSGEVSWDVTQDVLDAVGGAPFFGWMVKKGSPQNGNVRFYSREGAAAAGNLDLGPRLILEFPPSPSSIAARGVVDKQETTASGNLSSSKVESEPGISFVVQPNPFNPETTFGFGLERRAHVTMRVYDLQGRVVSTLLNEDMAAGSHSIRWDGRNGTGATVSSGTYYAQLVVGGVAATEKLIVLK
jgi:hypothetical protein